MSDIRFNRWLHQSGTGGIYQDASGRVGIGTDNPVQALHLFSSLPIIRVQDSDGTDQFAQFFHSDNATYIDNRNNTGKGSIFFRQYDGTTFVQSLQIDSQSNIGIGTDNPGIKVAVAGDVRVQNSIDESQYLTISHQGIDFQNTGVGSSTTSSSHLLDDYEEGTWTPTYLGTTGNPTITYTVQLGVYTKIGNTVHCQGRLQTSAASGGSGAVQVGNFPFECKTGNDRGVLNIGYSNDWVTQAPETGHMENGGNAAFLRYFSGNGTPTIVVGSNLRNVGAGDNDLMFDITYEVV